MRILHLIPSLSGGGAERQLSYLAPELARMGNEVHVGYLIDAPHASSFPGVVLHRLKSFGNHDPFLVLRLIRLVNRIRPDVIQTWLGQMDVLGGVASRVLRVRWILREPSSPPAYSLSWKHRARVAIAHYATAIVSNSREGDLYWSRYYPNKKRHIIRNGVPPELLNPLASDTSPVGDAGDTVARVLCVGRLNAYKNIDSVIAAVARLHTIFPLKLTICGEGPACEVLRKQAMSEDLADVVEWTGFLDSQSFWALMKRSDVFCSLSGFEGSPNTVLESMACGCPLVLSDIPSHRELLEADGALFVDPKDIEAVATAIQSCISDRAAARNRARAAQRNVMCFSVRAMACQYDAVYRRAVLPINLKHEPHCDLQVWGFCS